MAVTGDETESAATGDMPAYQLRSPTSSGLPQGLVMAASPGSLSMHNPPVHTEEVTRKREVRLMKNSLPGFDPCLFLDSVSTCLIILPALTMSLSATLPPGF